MHAIPGGNLLTPCSGNLNRGSLYRPRPSGFTEARGWGEAAKGVKWKWMILTWLGVSTPFWNAGPAYATKLSTHSIWRFTYQTMTKSCQWSVLLIWVLWSNQRLRQVDRPQTPNTWGWHVGAHNDQKGACRTWWEYTLRPSPFQICCIPSNIWGCSVLPTGSNSLIRYLQHSVIANWKKMISWKPKESCKYSN